MFRTASGGRWLRPVVFLCAAFLASASSAGEDEPAAGDPEPVLAVEIEVVDRPREPGAVSLPLDERDGRSADTLALVALEVPGVSGVRRAHGAIEPVVRGRGWERVATQIDGLPLYGACPARMDPPAGLVPVGAAAGARLSKGIASVTQGAGATGGRLMISTRAAPPRGEVSWRPWASAEHHGAGDGWRATAGSAGSVGPLALRGGLEIRRAGDYEAPDGLRVPASRDEQSVFVSLSGGAGPGSWWLTPIVQRGEDLDYPALPMDTERETVHLLTGGWRRARVAGPWSLELRGGLSDVDHRMSNAAKPNRDRLVAATDSLARSAALGLVARRVPGTAGDLALGLELGRQERDAVRERRLADGRTFRDHLWPDVTEERAGVFAEWQRPLARGWNLRLGARADRFRADAAGADGPGLGGRTVRESYARFYGAAAADVSRSDTLWTANAQASWRGGGGLGGYVGAGIVARAPAVTERYFAFAPAPGGFTVGNPSLAAERKREVVAGLSLERPQLFVAADLFHDDFTDYIHQAVVAELDLDGDGVVDTVRGYRNVEATLYGGELALVLRPRDRLRIPLALAWVRGRNDSAGVPLPEIPPLEGRAAVRVALAGPRERWLEVGVRVASRQDRIDPLFGEDATPGFAVWHLRSAFALGEYVVLGIGLKNLFDRAYHEHLTREAYFAAGDLGPGHEVPAPARHLVVTLRYGR